MAPGNYEMMVHYEDTIKNRVSQDRIVKHVSYNVQNTLRRTLAIFSILFITMLFFSSNSWGEEKVYTNKDLQKYSDEGKSSVIFKREAISSDEKMKRSVKPQNEATPRKSEDKPPLADKEQVIVSISGCRTIQNILDETLAEKNAVFAVERQGRTIEQICAAVGKGCRSCGEAPSQTGNDQKR